MTRNQAHNNQAAADSPKAAVKAAARKSVQRLTETVSILII